ncbi:MAG: hypothetical protein EU550_02280 [Promethearchaeota archaeon]|nr:MAG: hypothetical protein EU550_02280 [Candidatus Lokiarchaeota archaeon]
MVNKRLKEPYVTYGISVIITILAILFFQIVGYPRVVTSTQILDIYTSPFYMIPIFIPFGILLGELLWMLFNIKEIKKQQLISLVVGLILIGLLSLLRYILGLPYSGHTLILAFYIPNQIVKSEKKDPVRILIGFIIFLITSVYKLIFWLDFITYFSGLGVGFLIWIFSYLISKKMLRRKNI